VAARPPACWRRPAQLTHRLAPSSPRALESRQAARLSRLRHPVRRSIGQEGLGAVNTLSSALTTSISQKEIKPGLEPSKTSQEAGPLDGQPPCRCPAARLPTHQTLPLRLLRRRRRWLQSGRLAACMGVAATGNPAACPGPGCSRGLRRRAGLPGGVHGGAG
jgi:hypothetical protein